MSLNWPWINWEWRFEEVYYPLWVVRFSKLLTARMESKTNEWLLRWSLIRLWNRSALKGTVALQEQNLMTLLPLVPCFRAEQQGKDKQWGRAFPGFAGRQPSSATWSRPRSGFALHFGLLLGFLSCFSLSHLANSSFKLKQVLIPLAELNNECITLSFHWNQQAYSCSDDAVHGSKQIRINLLASTCFTLRRKKKGGKKRFHLRSSFFPPPLAFA